MKRIIYTVNLNKGKCIILTMLILILVIPIFVALFANGKKEGPIERSQSYNLSPNSIKFSNIKVKDDKVKIFLVKENKIIEMSLEEYLPGVVSSEMPANFDIEALKAQAVAARTYALAHLRSIGGVGCSKNSNADLCDTVHCQVFQDKESRTSLWPAAKKEEYWNKVVNAVKATEGEVITYNGELVMNPQYFSTSGGKTEDAQTVFGFSAPYLKSVDSPGEEIATKYKETYEFSYSNLANTINKNYSNAKVTATNLHKQLEILEKSEAGTVTKLRIGESVIAGTEFRFMLGLNSANFTISYNDKGVKIQCIGYGHGVGMSQWGANVMAQKGYKYRQILTHYYQGTKIEKIEK